jgi:LysR family transcriptional regulator of abg operon
MEVLRRDGACMTRGMKAMTIDPRRLRDLLRISQSGSFTHAAKSLNVSQPALSNSIAILERKLGIKLLHRDRNGATPTQLGEILLGYAETMESLLARSEQEIERRKAGQLGTLIVGVTPIAAGSLVPTAVSKVIAETPDVWIRVEEGLDDRLKEKLGKGEIDLMVGPIGISPAVPEIEEIPLLEDEFCILLRPGHALANHKSLSLKQLRDAHWVMPEIGTASRRQMELLFGQTGLPWPRHTVRSNSVAFIKAIVAESDCVSFISPRLVEREVAAGLLKCIPPRGARYARTIGFRRVRDWVPSALARRFLEALNHVVAEEARMRRRPLARPRSRP